MIDHAEEELKRAGLFDKDSDYGGMLGKAVMELIKVFRKQEHSGMSAHMTIELFSKLAKQKTLTPITDDPKEWTKVSDIDDNLMWQNNRDSSYFSKDGGKTWWTVDDDE